MSEPQERLEQYATEIETVQERMHERLRSESGTRLYTVWGLIWLVGYLFSFAQERWLFSLSPATEISWWYAVLWHWWALIPLGVWYSIRVSRRDASNTYRSSVLGAKFGAFWGLLYFFAFAGGLLLFPLMDVSLFESMVGSRVIGAMGALVPMFAYATLGLFFSRVMLFSGLTITVLIVVGFYAVPEIFQLWMAIVGSTCLFATGILAKKEAAHRPRELFSE